MCEAFTYYIGRKLQFCSSSNRWKSATTQKTSNAKRNVQNNAITGLQFLALRPETMTDFMAKNDAKYSILHPKWTVNHPRCKLTTDKYPQIWTLFSTETVENPSDKWWVFHKMPWKTRRHKGKTLKKSHKIPKCIVWKMWKVKNR